MTIKIKLIFIISFVILLFILVCIVFFIFDNNIKKINNEVKKLEEINVNLLKFSIETNNFFTTNFNEQNIKWEKSIINLENSLNQLKKLNMLPNLSENTSKSLVKIGNIIESLYFSIRETKIDMQNFKNKDLIFIDTLTNPEINQELKKNIIDHIKKVKFLDRRVNITLDALENQIKSINIIVEKKTKTAATLILIISIIILISIIIALTFSNMIANKIKKIEKYIKIISTGDLTQKFHLKSKDELGRLSINLNSFVDILSSIINNLKDILNNNKINMQQVTSNSIQTASTIKEIHAHINSINNQTSNLTDSIKDSSETMNYISNFVKKFENLIIKQKNSTNKISESIIDMSKSINLIINLINDKEKNAKHLAQIAKEGDDLASITVKTANETVILAEKIFDIIDIIKNISEKTNILAINASIEASHANNYGKGFVIVANEIRKFSAESNNNSKLIEDSIKNIINKIHNTENAATNNKTHFKNIFSDVINLSNALSEVNNSMNSISNEMSQIINEADTIVTFSNELRLEYINITENVENINNSFKNIDNNSCEVNTGISQINTGISQINVAVEDISNLNIKNNENITLLDEKFKFFKTK